MNIHKHVNAQNVFHCAECLFTSLKDTKIELILVDISETKKSNKCFLNVITKNISVYVSFHYSLFCLYYNINRSVLEHLVCSLSDGIINTYKALLNQSSTDKEHCVNQQRALQLIFDVKFLRMIIPRKDDCPVRYI
jgi:hypothetical protein